MVPGKYIVKLRDGASDSALNAAVSKLGSTKADHVYKGAHFKGFASKIDAKTLETIQNIPEVSTQPQRRLQPLGA